MNLVENLLQGEIYSKPDQKIYTTGFEGREVTALPQLLSRLEAILIDIRFAPAGMPLKWSKEYLKLLLKRKYLHVPSLGNRSYKETGKIAIQNLALGIKIITELRVNVLLMCECKQEEFCHRRQIKEKLKVQGVEVEEITNWI
jgi:uncharacterized protein (DUF488 family)